MLLLWNLINLSWSQSVTTPSPTRGEDWQSAEVQETTSSDNESSTTQPKSNNNTLLIVLLSILGVILFVIIVIIVWRRYNNKRAHRGMQRINDTDDETDTDEQIAFNTDGI